ncbi:DUF4132 domain-containing protein [Spirillospora sp. NPDC127200]
MTDENALALPPSWRGRLHPRRGGVPAARLKLDADAPERLRAWAGGETRLIEAVCAEPGSDPALVARLRAHRDGGVADPVGAAALAAVLAHSSPGYGGVDYEMIADAWITEHGLAFAAAAFVELAGVVTGRSGSAGPGRDYPVRPAEEGQYVLHLAYGLHGGRRVRALLAAASDGEYAEIGDRIAALPRTLAQRVAVAYLLPTRQDLVTACCAEAGAIWLRTPLLCSVGSAGQLADLAGFGSLSGREHRLDVLASAVEGVGAAMVPLLAETLGKRQMADARKTICGVLAAIPADEAFAALLDRLDDRHALAAVQTAMKRFPRRAARMLAEAAYGGSKLAANLPAALRPPASAADAAEVPEGTPEVLVSPPWTRKPTGGKPAVRTDLVPPADTAVTWADGQREEWAVRRPRRRFFRDPRVDWKRLARDYEAGTLQVSPLELMLEGPEEVVRDLLPGWRGYHHADAGRYLRPIAAKYGTAALPALLRSAGRNPGVCGEFLLPFSGVEVARTMADHLVRLKSGRTNAERWLDRHGPAAVCLLVPDALGRAGKARRNAESALRYLAGRLGAGAVVEIAREYDDAAAAAVGDLLAAGDAMPVAVPSVPGWAAAALLPPVRLRESGRELPAAAIGHLVTLLAMTGSGGARPEARAVREACDPGSLADFGWALFERWREAGAPAKHGWALAQLGATGDDGTVRALAPIVRAWPGEGGHAKAAAGLDVLAEIGTDVALTHLHGIAQRARYSALQDRAAEKIGQIAAERGLTAGQLADRLVPRLGLDASGGLALDYGPRRFHVGFDGQLKPFVTDQDGKPRKTLPKPGAKDDQALAAASYERFAALKKDARTVAATQIERLETAMVEGRRWTAAEFREHLAGHPLLRHIVRRLVWLAWEGEQGTAFRVAEDGTFADADDDAFPLPEGAEIGIAHPVHLGDAAEVWAEVFADYEILQPFRQLGRPVHALTDAERKSRDLDRFTDVTVPVGRVLGLERRGWRRGAPMDAGVQETVSRVLPGGHEVVVVLDPGIPVGHVDGAGDQRIGHVVLDRGRRFGDLGPVAASEMLADLAETVGADH